MVRILYPQLQAPVLTPAQEPEQVTESRWHQPWSEPVRFRPRDAWFTPYTTDPNVLPLSHLWLGYQPWSEPVRQKPGIRSYLQHSSEFTIFISPVPIVTSFNSPWSEPRRFKPAVLAGDQPFFWLEPEPPIFLDIPWFSWLSEPVRLPIGLRAWLQQFLAYHPRILPNPQVTAIMAATETNNDMALFAVQVYNPVTPSTSSVIANVSIVEIPAIQGGAVSIEG